MNNVPYFGSYGFVAPPMPSTPFYKTRGFAFFIIGLILFIGIILLSKSVKKKDIVEATPSMDSIMNLIKSRELTK